MSWTGQAVVFTGTLESMKREEAAAIMKRLGATVSSGVTRNTSLLVYGKDAGSKFSDAARRGVRTLSEREWLSQLLAEGVQEPRVTEAGPRLLAALARRRSPAAPILAAVHARQRATWGLTLGELLHLWVRLFTRRADIVVRTHDEAPPLADYPLGWNANALPPEVLAFAAEHGSLNFCWYLKDRASVVAESSEGYNGGKLRLLGVERVRWSPKSEDWQYGDWEAQLQIDRMVEEGVTFLAYRHGETPVQAHVEFDSANDCERYPMGSLEEYLTLGAKRAFVWYWQQDDWEGKEFREELEEASLPRDTPPEQLMAALVASGISEREASALHRWLGSDVVLLLPTG